MLVLSQYASMIFNVQLSVLVLAVGGKVLADSNGLLDEHVEVLWDLGGEA
jgi:hypothetical protein